MHSLSCCLWRHCALHVNTPPPPYAHHNAKPITHPQHTHTHSFSDSGMRKRVTLDFEKSTNLSLRLSSLPISFCLLPPTLPNWPKCCCQFHNQRCITFHEHTISPEFNLRTHKGTGEAFRRVRAQRRWGGGCFAARRGVVGKTGHGCLQETTFCCGKIEKHVGEGGGRGWRDGQ